MPRVLGIDIGTSSAKVSIVEIIEASKSFEVLADGKITYDQAKVQQKVSHPRHSQQIVQEIFECVKQAIYLVRGHLNSIDAIGVCGQQHGVVLWDGDQRYSDNYDWTDGRCDKQFLQTLPSPEASLDQISTGFGCATLFWLRHYQPDYVGQFSHSGTIMDHFVAQICGLKKIGITRHNAHSWGYFDTKQDCWNIDILRQADFPVHLLPEVHTVNKPRGKTIEKNIFSLPSNVPVFGAFGDLQSQMFVAFRDNPEALVLNMGTSAQLCRIMPSPFQPPRKSNQTLQSIDYDPYLQNDYLASVKSLNGGNVLRAFIDFLREIVSVLTDQNLSEGECWQRIIAHSNKTIEDHSTNLTIKPTLFGERHAPTDFAAITEIDQVPSLLQVTQCLCRSLVDNLFTMFSPDVFQRTTMLVCSGSILIHNPIAQSCLYEILAKHLPQLERDCVKFVASCDADVGVALLVDDLL